MLRKMTVHRHFLAPWRWKFTKQRIGSIFPAQCF